jgi:integrase
MSAPGKMPAGVRRLASGSFRAEVMAGGVRHSQTFPTLKAAAEWRAGLAARHERGHAQARRGGITFEAMWAEFDATRRDPATARKQAAWWNARIQPAWGKRPMRAVTGPALDAWTIELADDGLKESTIRTILYVVSAMYREANRRRYVEGNPVRQMTRRPRIASTTDRVVTDAEFDRLVDAAPDDATRALLIVMRDTGARIGEACAIPVRNVLDTCVVLSQRLDGQSPTIKPGLKNGDPSRLVPLTARMRDALAPLLVGKGGNDLVFTGAQGGPVDLHNWRRRTWWPMVEAARIPGEQPHPHDLRKTYATTLADAGLPLHDLMAALGQNDARSITRYLVARDTLVERLAALQDEAQARRAQV